MEEIYLCPICKLKNECPLEDTLNEYEDKAEKIVQELTKKIKGLEVCHTGRIIGEVHKCPHYVDKALKGTVDEIAEM